MNSIKREIHKFTSKCGAKAAGLLMACLPILGLVYLSTMASANASSGCDFLQPSSYVPNYVSTTTSSSNYNLRPRPNTDCSPIGLIKANSNVKVHAESGNWRFIENLSGAGWGWLFKDAIGGASAPALSSSPTTQPTPTSPQKPIASNGCDFLQPSSYVPNYVRTTTGSSNYNLRPQPNDRCTPIGSIKAGSQVKIHSESDNWRFIENLSGSGWGWIHKGAIDGTSVATKPKPPTPTTSTIVSDPKPTGGTSSAPIVSDPKPTGGSSTTPYCTIENVTAATGVAVNEPVPDVSILPGIPFIELKEKTTFFRKCTTKHFVILYDTKDTITTTDDAKKIASYLEAAYETYTKWGFSSPKVDPAFNRIRVSIGGAYIPADGYSRETVIQLSSNASYSEHFIYHELFHQFQWNYVSSVNGATGAGLRGPLESMADYAASRARGKIICGTNCRKNAVQNTHNEPWEPPYQGELFFLYAEKTTRKGPAVVREILEKFREGKNMYETITVMLGSSGHHRYRVWTLESSDFKIRAAAKAGSMVVSANNISVQMRDPVEGSSQIIKVNHGAGELMMSMHFQTEKQLRATIVDCEGVKRNYLLEIYENEQSLGVPSRRCTSSYIVVSHPNMDSWPSSYTNNLEVNFWVR